MSRKTDLQEAKKLLSEAKDNVAHHLSAYNLWKIAVRRLNMKVRNLKKGTKCRKP